MRLLYILLCDNKFYYVGITSNINKRFHSHKSGHNLATKRYSKVEIVYIEKYKIRKEAEKREKQLKRWSRAKKKALIEGNTKLLIHLSRNSGFGEGTTQGK